MIISERKEVNTKLYIIHVHIDWIFGYFYGELHRLMIRPLFHSITHHLVASEDWDLVAELRSVVRVRDLGRRGESPL